MAKLPVPENIPLRWELFRGFGKAETARSAAITGIVLVICVAACIITGSERCKTVSVFVVLFTIFVCVGFFGRIENQSIYDYLQKQRRFRSEQQIYKNKQKEVIVFVKPEKE